MTPTDANGQPLRLHRPENHDDANGATSPGGSPWLFDGEDASDSPAVTLSPGIVRGALLTLLVLLLLYALFSATVRGGRSDAAPAGVTISTSATPTRSPTASPTASPSSTPTPPSVSAPPVSLPIVPVVDPGALEAWYDATGRPLLEDLAAAVSDMQDYQDGDDTADLAEACTSLGDVSAEAVVSRPPGYDTQIASDWDDAADAAARASRDCLQGIADDDSALLLDAASSAQRATEYARAVIAQVENAID